jgi:hypothetical protein
MAERGWGTAFLQKQVEYLQNHDIEGLIRDHYHPEAQMVTFEFTCEGPEAIRKYLAEDEPAKAGRILGMTMNAVSESDDTILFTSTITSEKLGVFVARDALFFKDGKVYRHLALTLPPQSDRRIYEAMQASGTEAP